jgi:hypothetical protein
MSRTVLSAIVVGAGLALSCATRTPGAEPHEMSVATHETTAAQEQSSAAARERCRAGGARPGMDACWTSVTSPTAEDLRQVEKHRKAAADHRVAAQALRDAESRACIGVPDADRDESRFDHTADIESVEPFYVGSSGGKTSTKRLVGAIVTFRAVQGMTAQWLQRVVDCHLARNAALGHQVPEMPNCPLVPNGASATVTGTQNGFAVAVRGDDQATANEILRRAQSLMSR